MDRAIERKSRSMPEGGCQKCLEFLGGHLPRRHAEFGVSSPAKSGGMPVDSAIVRRIREHHRRALVAQQVIIALGIKCIAAVKPMVAQDPSVTWYRHRRF